MSVVLDAFVLPSPNTPKGRLLRRWVYLQTERQSWVSHWQDLAANIRPRGSRFLYANVNKGWKANDAIINSTPTFAERTLSAGMMSGITSPARPWFRLTTATPGEDEQYDVKTWLGDVEVVMRQVLARSNIYNCLQQVYSDLGTMGTAAMYIEDDEHIVCRGYVFPTGSYALANGKTGEPDSVYRELSLTVLQLVTKFGYEACSPTVRALYDSQAFDQWVVCIHSIEPNPKYRTGKLGPAGKRWLSTWCEYGGNSEGVLQVSGFDAFPVMAPRWQVTGEDVYGTSPAMEALGDCKALQQYERRAAQVVDKIVNPPMRAPANLRNTRASLLPGDITYVDSAVPGQAFAPAYEISPAALQATREKILEHEQRINRAFYADLWLMIAQSDGTMTAREVVERREEKLLQLGSVLERLQLELLDPLIDRVFAIAMRKGLLPRAPQALQGKGLRVEYISIMAQAQKLLGTTGIERLSGYVGQLAQLQPQVLDKVDFDHAVDEYANMLGTPPVLVVPDDQVAKVRAARAKAQAQQQQMAQAQQAADVAKTAAAAPVDPNNPTALTTMLEGLGAK